jgi:hypothetical protein
MRNAPRGCETTNKGSDKMTETLKRREGLRLTRDFSFYDTIRSHMFRTWAEGVIVTDPDDIALLTGWGAPVESVEPLEAGDSK